jgi:hypothetical protein
MFKLVSKRESAPRENVQEMIEYAKVWVFVIVDCVQRNSHKSIVDLEDAESVRIEDIERRGILLEQRRAEITENAEKIRQGVSVIECGKLGCQTAWKLYEPLAVQQEQEIAVAIAKVKKLADWDSTRPLALERLAFLEHWRLRNEKNIRSIVRTSKEEVADEAEHLKREVLGPGEKFIIKAAVYGVIGLVATSLLIDVTSAAAELTLPAFFTPLADAGVVLATGGAFAKLPKTVLSFFTSTKAAMDKLHQEVHERRLRRKEMEAIKEANKVSEAA